MIAGLRRSLPFPPVGPRLSATVAASLLGVSMLLSATSAAVPGPDDDGTNKTIPAPPAPPTLPTPSILGPPTGASTAPPSTEAGAETGIAIPAGADITQLFATASRTLEPTPDVAGSLGRLVAVPEGIPTPANSTIEEFSIQYYGPETYYVATARIVSSATPTDVGIFYETALTAAGFLLSRDDVQSADRTRRLQFETPDSAYSNASVEVLVDGDLGGSATLTIIDHADPDILAAFAGWARGMPTIADGFPVAAALSASRNPDVVVTVSTRFEYDDRSADQLTTQIREIIAGGGGSGFRIDDDDDDDGTERIAMTHPVIDDPVATISADDSGATSILMIGSLSTST